MVDAGLSQGLGSAIIKHVGVGLLFCLRVPVVDVHPLGNDCVGNLDIGVGIAIVLLSWACVGDEEVLEVSSEPNSECSVSRLFVIGDLLVLDV